MDSVSDMAWINIAIMDLSSCASQLDRQDKGTLTLGKHAMFFTE